MPKRDLFLDALKGDETAQLATMVQTLAAHVGCLTIFLPESCGDVKRSSLELCRSALSYLQNNERSWNT